MSMRHRAFLRPLAYFLSSVGLVPQALGNLRYAARYLASLRAFKRAGGQITRLSPILSDYGANAGTASGHYFHQDLLVATFVHASKPVRHIDVGSRIDGFVAHLAAFRRVEVLDIRPLPPTAHDNISFLQADLMTRTASLPVADSVSCLHALEHFGLGRYGDPVDPRGHETGFFNLTRMVSEGGRLYVGFPIGSKTEVHFNAHRVFAPRDILGWPGADTLELVRFDFVDDLGRLHTHARLDMPPDDLTYGCGIYTFVRSQLGKVSSQPRSAVR